mgnify:CR=1 FL=1
MKDSNGTWWKYYNHAMELHKYNAKDVSSENAYIDEYIAKYNIGGVTFFRTDAEKLLKQVQQRKISKSKSVQNVIRSTQESKSL